MCLISSGNHVIVIYSRVADPDFDTVFATLAQLGVGALVISPEPFFITRNKRLGALAFRYATPAICPYREFAAAGGLMSYGTNIPNLFREVGVYTSASSRERSPPIFRCNRR
jgi:putative tryptophan/tyrosine transport system substrate-binding protein